MMIETFNRNKLLITVFLVLLVIPLIGNGGLYYIGGDDMRLYYLFPDKYLENYVFNLIGGNTLAGANTGYATVAYYAPMFYFISLLKLIPLNTQFLMYGLNLAFGFLFFFKFLGLYTNKNYSFIKITASLLYILSPFLIITYYKNQMLSMYLISVIPITIYYFLLGIRENKYYMTAASTLIFSIFSTTLNTLPWWSAFLIPISLLLLHEFLNNKKAFLVHAALWGLSFLLINSYWIIHFVDSQIDGGGIRSTVSYYSAPDFLADNLRVMKGVSTLFSPLNIIFNSPGVNFGEKLSLVNYLNIIFISSSLLGLFAISRVKSKVRNLYLLVLLGFLVSWFMFSPNFGELGPRIFLAIGRRIPFFTMYRNMFDKFSLPLAFFFAGSIYFSLYILANKFSVKAVKILCATLIAVSLYNSKDFLSFKYSPEQEIGRTGGVMNSGYLDLVKYFESHPNKSKVVWLPLNFPTYANIEDQNVPGHYYSGLSPLRILADRSDYAGKFSFITETDLFAGDKLFDYLENGEYEKVGKLFQHMNAKYVVVDLQTFPDAMKPFLYGGEEYPLLEYQNEDFYGELLGRKIAGFGGRYDLYEINPEYDSDLIYLTDRLDYLYETNALSYKKISNHEYEISIKNVKPGEQIVFLESFNKNWKLYKIDNSMNEELLIGHSPIFNYANKWEIGNSLYEGEENINLRLIFDPI